MFAIPTLARMLAASLAALAMLSQATAEPLAARNGYPAQPIRFISPFPPGGGNDASTRWVTTRLTEATGQPSVVENRGGAGGNIGAKAVAEAKPDGYTVLTGQVSLMAVNPALYSAPGFDPLKNFVPITQINAAPLAIVVASASPLKSFADLVARSKGEPGRVTYATPGNGTLSHLVGVVLSKENGVPMTHVPYKGGAPAFTDLMGGQVDIFITVFGKAQLEMAQQGRLKFVATLSEERLEGLRQVPTLRESRALKDFSYKLWTGYFVRKDTPEPVVQTLYKALTATLSEPAVRAGLEAQSQQVSRPLSLQEAAQAYADGTAQFRALAKTIQLQPQ